MMMKLYQTILVVATLSAISGCRPATPTPRPIYEGMPIGECFWSATAEVWEDANGDGIHDPGEPPLPNVRVYSFYEGADETISDARTSQDGTTEFGAISNSCDWERYFVSIDAPSGYDFSTDPLIAFSEITNGGTTLFGLEPNEPITRTATPTITPLATTPTATPSPAPVTETPPPDAGFTACDAMSKPQAEAILGPLDGDPFVLEYIGPGPELVGLCVFPGSLNTASVEVYLFDSAANARSRYGAATSGGGEVIGGIGEAAVWDESQSMLTVLHEGLLVYIGMSASNGARDQAIAIGRLVVVRLP